MPFRWSGLFDQSQAHGVSDLASEAITPAEDGDPIGTGRATHMLVHGSDHQRAFDLLLKVTAGDDLEASAWEDWLRIQADRLISFHWNAVEAVAVALLEHQTISGAAVRALVRSSFEEPPR